jgi:hypothetical protein
MGQREVTIKQSVADNIAAIAWFIESKGLLSTAASFTDGVYDHFATMANPLKSYPPLKGP